MGGSTPAGTTGEAELESGGPGFRVSCQVPNASALGFCIYRMGAGRCGLSHVGGHHPGTQKVCGGNPWTVAVALSLLVRGREGSHHLGCGPQRGRHL